MHDRRIFRNLGIAVVISAVFANPLEARPTPQQQPPPSQTSAQSSAAPWTLDEVIKLIKQGKKDPHQAASTIAGRGVDFELDEKTEKKLRKAGADDQLLPQIWKVTPSGKAHMQALLTSPSGVEIQASPAEGFGFAGHSKRRRP
jgi:hypothetical protein